VRFCNTAGGGKDTVIRSRGSKGEAIMSNIVGSSVRTQREFLASLTCSEILQYSGGGSATATVIRSGGYKGEAIRSNRLGSSVRTQREFFSSTHMQ